MPNELHIPHFDYDQFLQGCVESISDPIEHIIHEGMFHLSFSIEDVIADSK